MAVQPGWKAGTRVHFSASSTDGFPPVTFVVQEAKHRYFTRRGDDLVWRKTLTREQVKGLGGCAALVRRVFATQSVLLVS